MFQMKLKVGGSRLEKGRKGRNGKSGETETLVIFYYLKKKNLKQKQERIWKDGKYLLYIYSV